jgi:hypothetical protein
LKPLVSLKKTTRFDLDDSKSRPLVLAIGYRYLPSPNEPAENRIEPVATFNYPLKAGFLLSDRNRADLDWKSGTFSWLDGADGFTFEESSVGSDTEGF